MVTAGFAPPSGQILVALAWTRQLLNYIVVLTTNIVSTLQCVVLIGIPKFEATSTVVAAPSSTEKPLQKKKNRTKHFEFLH